jgi:hypothetical protein
VIVIRLLILNIFEIKEEYIFGLTVNDIIRFGLIDLINTNNLKIFLISAKILVDLESPVKKYI